MKASKKEIRPSYIDLLESSELKKRSELAISLLERCELCPRLCKANRLKGETGYCKTGRFVKVASHNLHFGEEPPISGSQGSGTIFFSHCNLHCIFCQNYPISQLGTGKPTTAHELAQMMISLQEKGVHNINLVTPSHVVAQFIEALYLAAKDGLKIPIVYNSSGYEGLNALELLNGIVDIYMPDIKYFDDETALKYSNALNYWKTATSAVKEMFRQVGPLKMDENKIGVRGILIRHLILPSGLSESKTVFEFIANELSKEVPVNLMSQYFPAHDAVNNPIINRRITRKEFEEAESWLHEYGLDEGWIQNPPNPL